MSAAGLAVPAVVQSVRARRRSRRVLHHRSPRRAAFWIPRYGGISPWAQPPKAVGGDLVPARHLLFLFAGQMRAEEKGVLAVILPKERDPRFVTIRRGGTLTDADHQLLA